MKNSADNMKRKRFYWPHTAITYTGTRTQPGERGQPAGSKLARKARDMEPSRYRGGVVSKAYEQMAKDKRRA